MSKRAEERALKAYPDIKDTVFNEEYPRLLFTRNTERHAYIKSYEQAEKDFELTWQDMATIDSLITDVSNSYAVGNYDHDGEREHFYGEVLRRFKETKDGQVHQATEE